MLRVNLDRFPTTQEEAEQIRLAILSGNTRNLDVASYLRVKSYLARIEEFQAKKQGAEWLIKNNLPSTIQIEIKADDYGEGCVYDIKAMEGKEEVSCKTVMRNNEYTEIFIVYNGEWIDQLNTRIPVQNALLKVMRDITEATNVFRKQQHT
jgi:hypothetical protein